MKNVFKNKKFIISICMLLLLQAILYWGLKLLQYNPLPIGIPLDSKIPFIGYFIYIYDMFYPFVFLALAYVFLKDEKVYHQSILAGIMGYLICDVIFLLYPTIMIRESIPSYDWLTNLFINVTFYFDEPALNCFPSVHCLFCFQIIITYLRSNINNKWKIFNIISALLIIVSTLFVKQHYILDAISALGIITLTNYIVIKFKLIEKLKKKINY